MRRQKNGSAMPGRSRPGPDADVAHVDGHPAQYVTANGSIDVIGTRFVVTATDALTSVQVVRGEITLNDSAGGKDSVRAGEEGSIEKGGAVSVAPVPQMVHETEWAELFLNGKSLGRKKRGAEPVEIPVGPNVSQDRKFLTKYRRHAVVLIIIIGAFLTPGDLVWTTVALSVPLYLLYELSVFAAHLIYRRREKRNASLEPAHESGATA